MKNENWSNLSNAILSRRDLAVTLIQDMVRLPSILAFAIVPLVVWRVRPRGDGPFLWAEPRGFGADGPSALPGAYDDRVMNFATVSSAGGLVTTTKALFYEWTRSVELADTTVAAVPSGSRTG